MRMELSSKRNKYSIFFLHCLYCKDIFLLLDFSPVPYGRRLRLGRRAAKKQSAQGLGIKGEEGPEITETAEGGRGGDREQHQGKPDQETGQSPESGGADQEDAVET